MRFSIIIPTYNHCEDLLKPLCESIIKYTDLTDTEVIVVANGCVDNTREYVESLGSHFKLIWYDEPSGYTFSTNRGIEASTGEYVILLNNDCQLLAQDKDTWIKMLVEPFLRNDKAGISGPFPNFCQYAQSEFLIFFCVMIKREVFNKIGLLDEVFNPGYGEDTDFAQRLIDAGYYMEQAGKSISFYGPTQLHGTLPLYHAGGRTFGNLPNNNELFAKNNLLLKDKYSHGIDIAEAVKLDGFVTIQDLRWLALRAKEHKVAIEIGSWFGKSSRAIAKNLPKDGILYCVDTWNGSANEGDFHAEAKFEGGDYAFIKFVNNNLDLIQSGKIVPLRMSSENAAKIFIERNIKADFIFIDADHSYEGCKNDIMIWKDILSDNGLFSGHDYNSWVGVVQAVNENIINAKFVHHSSIWYCGKNDVKGAVKNKFPIYDTFLLNDELDILELRLNTLYDVVDRFVIVEGDRSHNNKPKALNFHNNIDRFRRFINKITYIVVQDWPATDSWSMERHQRDAIMRGLTGCRDSDIIIHGDCDEIARPEAIKEFDPDKVIMNFNQNFYYYNMTCKCDTNWDWLKITTYKNLKEKTPCGIRYTPFVEKEKTIYNGGWHFSFCTNNVDGLIHKLECTAHQEFNTDEYKNPEKLLKLMNEGKDILGRNITYKYVEVDSTYPKHVLENLNQYRHLIKPRIGSEIDNVYEFQCKNNNTEIFEHLPTLLRYSKECSNLTEFGVRDVVSTWAFLKSRPKKLTSYDIYKSPNINQVTSICKAEGVNFEFIQSSTLDVEIEETDLLFIDTLHVYQQLRAELFKHAPKVRKYIIMHDTTTFGMNGETNDSVGLLPAIDEFLKSNLEWKTKEVYTNLHGLTILERM